jgi:hypothetical protein
VLTRLKQQCGAQFTSKVCQYVCVHLCVCVCACGSEVYRPSSQYEYVPSLLYCPPPSLAPVLQMEGMVSDLQLAKEREKNFEGECGLLWLDWLAWLGDGWTGLLGWGGALRVASVVGWRLAWSAARFAVRWLSPARPSLLLPACQLVSNLSGFSLTCNNSSLLITSAEWRERKSLGGGMDMNVTVLTTGFWPTYKVGGGGGAAESCGFALAAIGWVAGMTGLASGVVLAARCFISRSIGSEHHLEPRCKLSLLPGCVLPPPPHTHLPCSNWSWAYRM